MQQGRRSFFTSLFGASGAAAFAGIPEPEKIESLKPGGIYAVYVDTIFSKESYDNFTAALKAEGERLGGIKFIVFEQGIELRKLK